jgi:uncharacterized protein
MVVELRPLGVKCNIQCQYCYQNPQRDAGNVLHRYDFDAMTAAVEREGGEFALFGGEPLLLPLPELERLWAWGLARSGSNGIQTNGTLITDAHIDLFRRYNVSVGVSLDGPGELNDARWGGTAERTRELTGRVEAVIERLCREGTPPRLIVTLHRGNASREKLPTLRSWFKALDRLGVRSVRLHLLEVDHADVRTAYALTPEENRAAVESLADLEPELAALRFDLFEDMRLMLLGRDESTTCVWNACDPYTTRAVRGVEGNGQRSNCGRTNKEGIDFVKAGVEGFERYLALYQTPQEAGGCKGCRFFLMCKGQCPGTGTDNDWRNRSEHCDVWKWAYARVEEELTGSGEEPLSLSPLREPLEAHFLRTWAAGRNTTMARALRDLPAAPVPVAGGPAPPPAGPFPDRLDFTLPPFTRVSWVSDEAREVWGPRLERLRAVAREVAWRSVAAGVRRCAILTAPAAQVRDPALAPWHSAGLAAARLGAEPADRPARVAVGRQADLDVLARALGGGDDRLVGQLLGQPDCCREFHRRVWVDDGLADATWPLAVASGGVPCGDRVLEVAGPPRSNPLWRWLGLQPAFHLPCRFDCRETVRVAERVAAAARAAGFGEEVGWLEEVLAWPVEWCALHGIAEVRTPILKVSTNTDATAGAYTVRRAGDRYPAEGARGVRFPYRNDRAARLTLSVDYLRGLAHAARRPEGDGP